MDDWVYVVVVIVSGMIGALAGIGGQTIKERWNRPKIKIDIVRHNDTLRIIAKNEGNRTATDLKSALFFKSEGKIICTELPKENLDPECHYIAVFGIAEGIDLDAAPRGADGPIILRIICSATDVPEYVKSYEITKKDDGTILTKEIGSVGIEEFMRGHDIIALPKESVVSPD
jgi:hypothetical protein